jgi:antitoxin (DNA-binding transcriptional repressor) of toxin-antitoxin stability system
MTQLKNIGKREFIQHTSKYISWVAEQGNTLIITHHNRPDLILSKIKNQTIQNLSGSVKVKIHGNINDPVLPGYDEW